MPTQKVCDELLLSKDTKLQCISLLSLMHADLVIQGQYEAAEFVVLMISSIKSPLLDKEERRYINGNVILGANYTIGSEIGTSEKPSMTAIGEEA